MTNRFVFCFFLLLIPFLSFSQISEGGLPTSFLPENAAVLANIKNPVITIPAPDMQKVMAEDDLLEEQGRFSVPLSSNISLENAGKWADLPNGDRIWRCELTAPDAKALILIFDQFYIPAGGKFFAYDPAQKTIYGAYTAQSNQASEKFLIGLIDGDTAVLEYYEPASAKGLAKMHLNRIDYGYHQGAMVAGMLDFGNSLACHVNINCQTAASWFWPKKGVARILMVFSNGTGWCTGSLIANADGTGEPLFLTAHHCQILGNNPDFSMWRFDFNYEAPNCPNPTSEPTAQSVLGCERLAYKAETDFMLLKTNPIPASYGVWFNGWDRRDIAPPYSVFIHHPKGDIKKFSSDNDAPEIFPETINWGAGFGVSPINTHLKVIPETGTFEPGSSGCPLLEENRRIVGQLHGGNANPSNPCFVNNTFFGRLSVSWNLGATPAARLKEWLDPSNTGKLTQDGYVMPAPALFSISGNIKTADGVNMTNVKVTLSDGANAVTYTDANGNYTFTNLPKNLNYTVAPSRDTNDINGVSTIDMLNMSKHILGILPLDSPWKIIASDANQSNSISTFDVVELRKLVLGIYTAFPANSSWRFFPADTQFTNPTIPFPTPGEYKSVQYLQQNITDFNFIGVKIGDNNASANPGQ